MGIYTSNRYYGGEVPDYAAQIPANEAYDAAFGCAHILADCQTNDMALFESAIFSDMQEVMAVQEGVQVVNENAFTNVIKKIVEMFKKLLAKIKGIFSAFFAKLNGAFKNGKDLVKKYEKQIIKYSNWKYLKIKGIRKPKSNDIKNALTSTFSFKLSNKYDMSTIDHLYLDDYDTVDIFKDFKYKSIKAVKDAEADDIKTEMLKSYINGVIISDYKEMDTDIKDHLYNEEDTLDGEDDIKSASFFSNAWIKSVLSDEKWENDVQKDADRMEKLINKIIDDLNKTDNNLATFISKTGKGGEYENREANFNKSFGQDGAIKKDTELRSHDSTVTAGTKTSANNATNANANLQKAVHALQTLASNEQEVITKVTSVYMENIKFATAQARKIWTAAAAWSSTEHKESVEYYQALGEAAAEQFYMNMETIGA